MIEIRPSEQRGPSDLGWLQSRHTFSFAGYYDPQHMGVSALRVINDDRVAPGAGFATHSHQDMEIISYVKQGSIEHRDSMGNVQVLPAGEFQLMSAGTGVTHSEYNPSSSERLEFLQIWIEPNQYGIEPAYQQKRFAGRTGLQLIASPDGRESSLLVHQDACLYQLLLATDQRDSHALEDGRTGPVGPPAAVPVTWPCWKRSEYLLLDALNTARSRWIGGKAANVYLFAAYKAVAVLARLDAAQGTLDLQQLVLTPPGGFDRHLLCLHGIHARKPSHPGLVQFHRPAGLPGCQLQFLELSFQTKQFLPDSLNLSIVHRYPVFLLSRLTQALTGVKACNGLMSFGMTCCPLISYSIKE
jgi:hypothetical protein